MTFLPAAERDITDLASRVELTLVRKKYFSMSVLLCNRFTLSYSDSVKRSAPEMNPIHTNTAFFFYELYILG